MNILETESLQLRLFPDGGLPLEELPTPCLLLDLDRLERNIERLRRHWSDSPVTLRPHLKTCRSWPVALTAMGSGNAPCCTATMGEAEACAELGATDITLAVGIRPCLFERVRGLMARGCDCKVVLDSMTMTEALVRDAQTHDAVYQVLVEIDCDGHRAGLSPEDERIAAIADRLRDAGQQVRGVLTHAGTAYDIDGANALRALALQEARAAGRAARLLRGRGHACPTVSVGSTPTALLGDPVLIAAEGVTEVRCGVYMFMDLVMEGLGVCTVDDMALSVLASVIGGFAEDGGLPARIVTDAGWAALSPDRGLARRFAAQGYGLVCGMNGSLLPGVVCADLNQEHGMLRVDPSALSDAARETLQNMNADTRLRITPNHACATAMMHKGYHLVRGGRAVALARRFGGW